MRWYAAKVYRREQTGTDATRNPTYELFDTGETILVRTAPMAPRHNDTAGNQFDVVERTFLTKAAKSAVDGAAALEVCGEPYEVLRISEWGDPIAIRVRRCKPWGSG